MTTLTMLQKDTKNVIRHWKRTTLLAVFLCVIYVMIFPLVQLCAYFDIIDLDSWVGDLVLFMFWPLFWLNDDSLIIHQFFVWLGEIYMSPFTKCAQGDMWHQ